MKSIGKILVWAVVGFLSGYLFMFLLKDSPANLNISFMSFEMTIIFMTLSIALIIFSLYGFVKIKSEAKRHVTGDEEDERDAYLYKRYSDIMLAASIAMYFSILMLALVAVTDQHNAIIFISFALLLVSISLNILYSGLVSVIYPDRNLPSLNDKQYAKKLLEVSDEGERHVMLHGMYRAYSNLNALLLLSLFLFIGYSVISGVSQLFSIVIIVLILVITNTQYMLTIRNK